MDRRAWFRRLGRGRVDIRIRIASRVAVVADPAAGFPSMCDGDADSRIDGI
jgi:hypothetical protein